MTITRRWSPASAGMLLLGALPGAALAQVPSANFEGFVLQPSMLTVNTPATNVTV